MLFQKYPRVHEIKSIGERSYIVSIPRYQEFTDLAVRLGKDDVHFVQIAGNDEITVSAIVQDWTHETREEHVLLLENVVTRPDLKRVVLECRVRDLHKVLNDLATRGTIEHVYDY